MQGTRDNSHGPSHTPFSLSSALISAMQRNDREEVRRVLALGADAAASGAFSGLGAPAKVAPIWYALLRHETEWLPLLLGSDRQDLPRFDTGGYYYKPVPMFEAAKNLSPADYGPLLAAAHAAMAPGLDVFERAAWAAALEQLTPMRKRWGTRVEPVVQPEFAERAFLCLLHGARPVGSKDPGKAWLDLLSSKIDRLGSRRLADDDCALKVWLRNRTGGEVEQILRRALEDGLDPNARMDGVALIDLASAAGNRQAEALLRDAGALAPQAPAQRDLRQVERARAAVPGNAPPRVGSTRSLF